MFRRPLGRFLGQLQEPQEPEMPSRSFGQTLEVSNEKASARPISARLLDVNGGPVQSWKNLNGVIIYDVSISVVSHPWPQHRVKPPIPEMTDFRQGGMLTFRSVLPRILKVQYDEEENVLKVYEIEPQALIPG